MTIHFRVIRLSKLIIQISYLIVSFVVMCLAISRPYLGFILFDTLAQLYSLPWNF